MKKKLIQITRILVASTFCFMSANALAQEDNGASGHEPYSCLKISNQTPYYLSVFVDHCSRGFPIEVFSVKEHELFVWSTAKCPIIGNSVRVLFYKAGQYSSSGAVEVNLTNEIEEDEICGHDGSSKFAVKVVPQGSTLFIEVASKENACPYSAHSVYSSAAVLKPFFGLFK